MPAPSTPTRPAPPGRWRTADLSTLVDRWTPLVGLALITVLAAIMYGHVFAAEVAGDDNSFHLAEVTRMADCLRAGDFDLWNPSANAGYASAYYYQAIPQLTPAALAVITGSHVLFWFQLCVFLPLVLAPAAAYRALRVLGTPAWPALGGAFAILMCASNSRWGFGADGQFSVGLYTQTWALAAFPLGLAYGVRWLRDGTGLGAAAGWGLFVGVCHPFAGVAIGLALAVGAAVSIGRGALRAVLGDVPAIRGLARALDVTRWGRRATGDAPPAAPAPEPPLSIRAAAVRLPALGILLVIGSASAWLPVMIDYAGFGGFPHRVADEVGPGFKELAHWLVSGQTLDCAGALGRWRILTLLLPFAFVFGRGRALPWLWSGALVFAVLLGLGPHLGKSGGDDLFPMVRFYGPLQICLALAIGAGVVTLGTALWQRTAALGDPWLLPAQAVIAAAATAAVMALSITGMRIAQYRARVSTDYASFHRDEIREVTRGLAAQPAGRKQARNGTEGHWFNLLPYVDARVPALFQMGGAGLQSSPNYDFLWTVHDWTKLAWVYDAPYITFTKDNADQMPDGEAVLETETFMVRRLPAPGLVSPVEIAAAPLPAARFAARKAAIKWLEGDDPLADKLIAYAGSPGLATAPSGQVLDVKRQDSPGDEPDIVAQVTAERPTTFVVRESWHPRWRGFVDDHEVRVRRVTPDFFAVDVPAGKHVLGFRFDRPWWAWASWLLLVLATIAGWLLGPRIGRLGAGVSAPSPAPAKARPAPPAPARPASAARGA